jgi:hypothetical protein
MIIQRKICNFALAELFRTIEKEELEKALEPYLRKLESEKEAETEANEKAWTDFLENKDSIKLNLKEAG